MAVIKLNQGLKKTITGNMRRVAKRATVRATVAGRSEAIKEISKEVGIKTKVLRGNIKRTKDGIRAVGGPRAITDFKGFRKTKKSGLVAEVKKEKERFKGGFVARGRPFERDPKNQNKNRPGNLTKHSQKPRVIVGPGIAGSFKTAVSKKQWEEKVLDTFKKEFSRQFKRKINGR